MLSFEEFLKSKNRDEKPIDWVSRRENWLRSVEVLYRSINLWLTPFVVKSLLTIDRKNIRIYEEYLGEYTAIQLNIKIGNDIVSLVPQGTMILGSYGRIDLQGPKGSLIIIEPKWDEWKFVTRNRYNQRELTDVNEASFEAAIQDVING